MPERDRQLGLTSCQKRNGKGSQHTGNPKAAYTALSPTKSGPVQGARHSSNCPGRTWPRGPRGGDALTEPAVRHHTDEVLRGQRFKDGHEERNEVLVLRILGLE